MQGRVKISGGTYHHSELDKPTGTIVGTGSMVVAGQLVAVYMVELDRSVYVKEYGDKVVMELTHLPVGEQYLTPIV